MFTFFLPIASLVFCSSLSLPLLALKMAQSQEVGSLDLLKLKVSSKPGANQWGIYCIKNRVCS